MPHPDPSGPWNSVSDEDGARDTVGSSEGSTVGACVGFSEGGCDGGDDVGLIGGSQVVGEWVDGCVGTWDGLADEDSAEGGVVGDVDGVDLGGWVVAVVVVACESLVTPTGTRSAATSSVTCR